VVLVVLCGELGLIVVFVGRNAVAEQSKWPLFFMVVDTQKGRLEFRVCFHWRFIR